MAKKTCELCQQNLTNDMRFGVSMCQNCIDLYSRALSREPDAVIHLSDPQNFPYATDQAKNRIINRVAELKPSVINITEETATQNSLSPEAPTPVAFIPPVQSHSGLDGMYSDIGKKIKAWAKWVFVVSAIASVIVSLVLIFSAEYEWTVVLGIISLIVGPLAAWVSSWILYGFGELIDKTSDNEKHTQDILRIMIQNNSQNNSR